MLQWFTLCRAQGNETYEPQVSAEVACKMCEQSILVARRGVLWGLCTSVRASLETTLMRLETTQEHEAKKDNPNVRPHLEKDQAIVGMGSEHVAPGAGGMHTEVRACTCSSSLASAHGASALLNIFGIP